MNLTASIDGCPHYFVTPTKLVFNLIPKFSFYFVAMKLNITLSLLVVLLLGFGSTQIIKAQDTLLFNTYGSTADEEAFDALPLSNGNILVTGSSSSNNNGSSDFYALLLDSNLQFIKSTKTGFEWQDWGIKALELSSGKIALVGNTYSIDIQNYTPSIVFLQSQNSLIAEMPKAPLPQEQLLAADAALLANDSLVIFVNNLLDSSHIITCIVTDSLGNFTEKYKLNFGASTYINRVIEFNNSWIFAGKQATLNEGSNAFMARVNFDFTIEWQQNYGGSQDQELFDVVEIPYSKKLFGAGKSNQTADGDYDIYFVQVDSNGVFQAQDYGGHSTTSENKNDAALSIVKGTTDKIWVSGYTETYAYPNTKDLLMWVVNDAGGYDSKSSIFGNWGNEWANKTLRKANGALFVGATTSYGNGNSDVLIAYRKSFSGNVSMIEFNNQLDTTQGVYVSVPQSFNELNQPLYLQFNSNLQITYSNPIVLVELYNLNGQKLLNKNTNSTEVTLELPDPTGMYVVVCTTQNGQHFTKKFIPKL